MFELVDNYLKLLSGNNLYIELTETEKIKVVFTAGELLKDHFPNADANIRAIALQVLYTLEGDDEEFAKLKRHGVKSFSTKGISVSFEGTGIAPDVIHLLEPKKSAYVGRLI